MKKSLNPLPVVRVEGSSQEPPPFIFPDFSEPVEVAPAEPVSQDALRLQQMEAMLKEAQGRAELAEREAYDKAYAAGEKAGMALGKKRAEQILQSMEGLLCAAEKQLVDMNRAYAEVAIDLSQSLTEVLIGKALREQQDALFNAAMKAAEQLPELSSLQWHVHPDDEENIARLLEQSSASGRIRVDGSVRPGTCRLVSKQQDIWVDPVEAVARSIEPMRQGLLELVNKTSLTPQEQEPQS